MIKSLAHWLTHQLRDLALSALGIREEVRLVRRIGPELEEWRQARDEMTFDELCPAVTDAELIEDHVDATATTKPLTDVATQPLTPHLDRAVNGHLPEFARSSVEAQLENGWFV